MADERDLLRIDIEGTEARVVIGSELRRRLGALPGSYRLLPTSGDLVLLQRVPSATASPDPVTARVLLSGEIARLGGLADVIHFIHTNAWPGHLDIINGQVRKALYYRRGDIQSAASNLPDDRLGAILFRYGLVDEENLNRVLARVAGSPNRIGQLLVEENLISAHELYTSMRRQVEEIFYSVLGFRSGDFYFYRSGEDDGPPSQLLLSTKALLFEGVRRIDELSYFREKLPSDDMVLVRREPAPSDKLKPTEERVVQLIDGMRTIAHVSRASHLGEFETTRVLYQLLQSGWVQPRTGRAALDADVAAGGTDLPARIVAVFNEVYVKVHAAVAHTGKAEGLHRGLESFFSSVAEFSPLFVGVTLAPDGSLPPEQLLSNLLMCPVEDKLDYLHRGLNELLFFELFTAGEAVDRREEIELHQRLSHILKEVRSGESLVKPEPVTSPVDEEPDPNADSEESIEIIASER